MDLTLPDGCKRCLPEGQTQLSYQAPSRDVRQDEQPDEQFLPWESLADLKRAPVGLVNLRENWVKSVPMASIRPTLTLT